MLLCYAMLYVLKKEEKKYVYICTHVEYIYIYIERERDIHIHKPVCTYVYGGASRPPARNHN